MKYRIGMLAVCMGSLLTGWAHEANEEQVNAVVSEETNLALGEERAHEAKALTASIHHEMEFHALKHEMKILVEQLVGLKSKLIQVEEENKLYQNACSSLQSLVLRLGTLESQINELQEVIKVQQASIRGDQKIERSVDVKSNIITVENLMPEQTITSPAAVERKFNGAWRVFSSLFRSKIKG